MARPMSVSSPARVRLVDVGPRDGLQNEPGSIDIATKVALIERLGDAGLSAIEAASFTDGLIQTIHAWPSSPPATPEWIKEKTDANVVIAPDCKLFQA